MIWYVALVAFVYVATQVVALLGMGLSYVLASPGVDVEALLRVEAASGLFLSAFTITSAATCMPLVYYLTSRREARPWEFLGFRHRPSRDILLSVGAVGIFIVASDSLAIALGRPIVSPFMVDAYATARWPALLFVAIVLVAPVAEELLFRGFLYGGLRACGAPLWITVIVVSSTFAALHTQYDVYDITHVFALALMFIGARVRFDSIVPGVAMHSLANAYFRPVLTIAQFANLEWREVANSFQNEPSTFCSAWQTRGAQCRYLGMRSD